MQPTFWANKKTKAVSQTSFWNDQSKHLSKSTSITQNKTVKNMIVKFIWLSQTRTKQTNKSVLLSTKLSNGILGLPILSAARGASKAALDQLRKIADLGRPDINKDPWTTSYNGNESLDTSTSGLAMLIGRNQTQIASSNHIKTNNNEK